MSRPAAARGAMPPLRGPRRLRWVIPAVLLLVGGEGTPLHRRDAHDLEEGRGHPEAVHALGFAGGAQVHVPWNRRRQGGEGGRLASPLGAAGDGPLRFNLVAQPTPENLQRLGELLDDRTLRVHLQRNYLLAHAAEALQALSNVHKQGKLGVEIA